MIPRVLSLLIVVVFVALAWLTVDEEGPLHWMGVFWFTQGAGLYILFGAMPNALPSSARLFNTVCRLLNTKTRVMTTAIAFWIVMLAISYLLGTYARLEFGITEMLCVCFPLSTYLFYAGRHVVTKSLVKALDYFTIAAAAGTLVSVAELDTQIYKERVDVAMADAKTIAEALQPKLDQLLVPCDKGETSDETFYLSFLYWKSRIFGSASDLDTARKRVFCYCFGEAKAAALPDLLEPALHNMASRARSWSFTLPDDPLSTDTIDLFQKYAQARGEYEAHKDIPMEAHIPKSLAYLLVAFAFAVRLTRTTVEVFEWHDVAPAG